MEISIYTFAWSGIMENWMKHELYHLNNEILWWHDSWQYVITWHTWQHVKAWLHKHWVGYLTSFVAVSELDWWFYFCFARHFGRKIHYKYRRLHDLHAWKHAWPWNWRSRHGLQRSCSSSLSTSTSSFLSSSSSHDDQICWRLNSKITMIMTPSCCSSHVSYYHHHQHLFVIANVIVAVIIVIRCVRIEWI